MKISQLQNQTPISISNLTIFHVHITGFSTGFFQEGSPDAYQKKIILLLLLTLIKRKIKLSILSELD